MQNLRQQISHFRTNQSANQFIIFGAAANWCGEVLQLILGQTHLSMEESVHEGERSVISEVGWTQSYRHQGGMIKKRETASVLIIQDLNCRMKIQITKACESAGFMKRVSIGMYFETVQV